MHRFPHKAYVSTLIVTPVVWETGTDANDKNKIDRITAYNIYYPSTANPVDSEWLFTPNIRLISQRSSLR
jgi:hypothetical protein